MTTPQVRTLAPADARAAAICAARAFYDDPVLGWIQPSRWRQQRGFPATFAAIVEDALAGGEAVAAYLADRVVGVAAWLRPGQYPRAPRRDAVVALRGVRGFLPPGPRSLTGIRLLVAVERAHPHEEHWYLQLLAVDPLWQGHGVGRALLTDGLARADAERAPTYLETQKPENVPWYARSGFEVTQEFRVGRCPPVWGMARAPR